MDKTALDVLTEIALGNRLPTHDFIPSVVSYKISDQFNMREHYTLQIVVRATPYTRKVVHVIIPNTVDIDDLSVS